MEQQTAPAKANRLYRETPESFWGSLTWSIAALTLFAAAVAMMEDCKRDKEI
jgi:hypothetical protein